MESQINVIFNVCHHACCCMNCADDLLKTKSEPECPQCRAKLISSDTQPIYNLFYLNGVTDSGASSTDDAGIRPGDAELKNKISEQATQLRELQQQLQLIKTRSVDESEESEESEESAPGPTELYRPPMRRPTGYNLFLINHYTNRSAVSGSSSSLLRTGANAWKELPESAKYLWNNRAANQ